MMTVLCTRVDARRFIHNYPVYGATVSKVRAYFMFTDYYFHYHYIDTNTDHVHRWLKISESEYDFLSYRDARFSVRLRGMIGSKIKPKY